MIFSLAEQSSKRDAAMESIMQLGPKIDPPQSVTILGEEWSASAVKLTKYDLKEAPNRENFCILLENILSIEECRKIVSISDKKTAVHGTNSCATGTHTHDDAKLSEEIWQRVLRATQISGEYLKSQLKTVPWIHERHPHSGRCCTYDAVGLHERMEILHWDVGSGASSAVFGDSKAFVRGNEAGVDRQGEKSFLTVHICLNDDFEGGKMKFLSAQPSSPHKATEVEPPAGSILLFQHDCYHEFTPVSMGQKYALCTNVMYTNKGPGWDYSSRPLIARQLDDIY